MNTDNTFLCAYPWRSAAIRPDGSTMPCCRYPHLTDYDCNIKNGDPRLSKHWTDLRESMLSGKHQLGCKSCYQDEKNSVVSMRQSSLKKMIPINNEVPLLNELEVSFSNLCNLACAHCSNYFSSKWYSEDVKFGRIKKSGAITNDFNMDQWDLNKLTYLKIIGGEPLMEQNKFIKLLKNLNLAQLEVQICTNGTILPNKELELLLMKCKKVNYFVSLDGLNSINDWYRWPSKFDDLEKNMHEITKMSYAFKNIQLAVHHVVNVLNVFEITKFIEFIKNNFPDWKIEWDWVRWPHWQEITVLPEFLKNKLVTDLNKFLETYKFDPAKNFYVNPIQATINRLSDQPNSTWEEFKQNVHRLSQERSQDFKSMLPISRFF